MKIRLVPYDPQWPRRFETEAGRIRAALGPPALQIHHAGSTAVPGLPAKPVIDIVLAVPDSADEPAYAPALEAAGYRFHLREPDWHQHRLFKGAEQDVNLHVFTAGCPEIDRMLTFRDRLRANPADRDRYARAKQALAEQEWACTQNYADAKTEIVREILSRAGC